tara:strand:- start:563 stop:1846 length:1284 start_codon:yes stop_codon:yes gene_type:complete
MVEQSSFSIGEVSLFKRKLLHWANQFKVFICLDNNEASHLSSSVEFVVGVDKVRELSLTNEALQFKQLEEFQHTSSGSIYGYLAYDLKNELEQLHSKNPDHLEMPNTYFFEPRYTFHVSDGRCTINRSTLESIQLMDQINAIDLTEPIERSNDLEWKSRMSKEAYIQHLKSIKNDILEGTVYELNFCRELYANTHNFNSLAAFLKINENAKAPFSAYLKMLNHHVLSFSPERFMKHENRKIISQPIKGTLKKGSNIKENKKRKLDLFNDEKERAENVMIVDLVRNDFAKSAMPGTVKVDELFGIYEFENIIQMISTVSAHLKQDIHPLQALRNAYPMGSMTGAPKVMAMHLIDHYEQVKRGVYSGALGYINTDLSYDFNVLIRTLIFNEKKGYLSLQVGGAITYDAIPENEWEETLVKANSILKYLG